MKHLFEPQGEAALRAVMRAQPLLAFDFDGTLAPIVPHPDDARVPAGIAARLGQLALHRPVAIVTGRAIADVATRLGFSARYIVGNHGAERGDDGAAAGSAAPGIPKEALAALQALRERIAAQSAELAAAGVQVEDKTWSFSLHYRLAPDHPRALAAIAALLKDQGPALRSFGGKCIVNVVGTGAPDKADAVLSLAQREGTRSLVFVGDDVNDEPVFARAQPGWLTVRIGRDDPASKAAFFLDSHGEIELLLGKMLALLDAPRPA